jgi:hypothetical protein
MGRPHLDRGAAAVCVFEAGLAVYILRRRETDDHA